jgi:V/A-type H+-transporting ATPase subunit C
MVSKLPQPGFEFFRYPPIGGDDWAYLFEIGQVRVLEMRLLTRAALMDMAGAPDFEQAVELLSGTEYVLPPFNRSLAAVESVLRDRRTAVRALFSELMINKRIAAMMRWRDDFANLRLGLRRVLTKKPVGDGYSDDGSAPVERLKQALSEENFASLPNHMQTAVEDALGAYYVGGKEIPRIDYAIDACQSRFNLTEAARIGSPFLLNFFRIQADLTNIRTMFRLKFRQSDQRNVFLDGGFLSIDRLTHCLDVGYEAAGAVFHTTPYHELVAAGAAYLASHGSFLMLERHCEEYMLGFLRSTRAIVTGHQPLVAYLLMKENEIRAVRTVLTARANGMELRLILDRLGE